MTRSPTATGKGERDCRASESEVVIALGDAKGSRVTGGNGAFRCQEFLNVKVVHDGGIGSFSQTDMGELSRQVPKFSKGPEVVERRSLPSMWERRGLPSELPFSMLVVHALRVVGPLVVVQSGQSGIASPACQ